MATPLMPKATALWLVENTSLTFEQISAFCGLHILEVQAIADGEVGQNLIPFDPIINNQLTLEEIHRCEQDPTAHLALQIPPEVLFEKKSKGARYTPLSRRGNRPSAIAWILKNYPEVKDLDICKLLGTTKNTIESIRTRTHRNSQTIKPNNPVTLGLCTQEELDRIITGNKKQDSQPD
jgi:hypothetical protein